MTGAAAETGAAQTGAAAENGAAQTGAELRADSPEQVAPGAGERPPLAFAVAAPGTVGVPGAAPFLLVGDADAGVCVDGVCAVPPRG